MRFFLCVVLLSMLVSCQKGKEPRNTKQAEPTPLAIRKESTPALPVAEGKIEARIYLDEQSVGVKEAALSTLTIQPGTVIPAHVHPEATELLYIAQGEGELVLSGEKKTVRQGDTLLLPAGVVHGFTATSQVFGIQAYLPGGPEQRFRGQSTQGTVKPEESSLPDPKTGKISPPSDVSLNPLPGNASYQKLLTGEIVGQQSIDLLLISYREAQEADVHAHESVSELVFVLQGGGRAIIDGKEATLQARDAYYTPKGAKAGFAPTAGTTLWVLVVK